jgi:hypothetical protein
MLPEAKQNVFIMSDRLQSTEHCLTLNNLTKQFLQALKLNSVQRGI